MARTFRAKFIASMALPLIADGAVVIGDDRRIAAVGPFELVRDGNVEDLGEVVLLPGLVNAHTHLELSNVARGDPPASFGAWVLGIVRSLATPPTDDAIRAATRAGTDESLRFGVATVGDITRSPHVTRAAILQTPLRGISFGEVRAMGTRRDHLASQCSDAVDESLETDRLRVGISPHAPYSVEPDGYRACIASAVPVCPGSRTRLTTHLAESPEEAMFLSHHAGPLRDLWDAIGAWDDRVPRFAGSPVTFAKSVGLLDAGALLAHVNYADDADLDLLAAGNASVVFCPRTHAWFGHSPHRWQEMLARGINVCVGTDSKATSPDLNIVDDLRLLHRQSPAVEPEVLWELITTRGARALGIDGVGTIRPGAFSDLIAFPARSNDPLREVLESNVLPQRINV